MSTPRPTLGKILPNDRLSDNVIDGFNARGRLLYAIPRSLVDAISGQISGWLDQEASKLELALADSAEAQGAIAFRDGCAVNYRWTEPFRPIRSADVKHAAADPESCARELNHALGDVHQWAQAYLGWLMQNEDFRVDVTALAEIGCGNCLPLGAPPAYPADVGGRFLSMFSAEKQQQVREVCKRWRLDAFASLDLPIPLEPHFTACSPYNENSRTGGAAPFIPDTFPMKGRGEMLDRIRSAKPTHDMEHLRDWMEVISPSSKQGPKLISLARSFRLQHYWRVVHSRHVSRLSRKRSCLYKAFATFLDERDETIRKEVPKIELSLDHPLSN